MTDRNISRRQRTAAAIRRGLTRARDTLVSPVGLLPLALLLATWLGFIVNVALYMRATTPAWSYDPGLLLAALLPAMICHGIALGLGRRSPLWWCLWFPGIALYATRPWKIDGAWQATWVFDNTWPWFRTILFNYSTAETAVLFAFAGFVIMATITAGVGYRLWKGLIRAIDDATRDGPAGSGHKDGLPQATWASRGEIRQRFTHPGGIVLGEHSDPIGETPGFDPGRPRSWGRQGTGHLVTIDPGAGNGHALVLAPSAGYKTAGIVIPNILTYDGPLVVVDPKGDLYARTREAREAMGYRAIVIDAETGFDPFKAIAPLAPDTPSVYYTMAKTLMPAHARSSENSEYFHDMSVSLFAALMAYYVERKNNNVAGEISRFINRKREDVIEEAQDIAATYPDLPYINDEMSGIAALDDRTFPGVVKGISNKLAFVRFPDIQAFARSDRSPADHIAALGPKSDIFINLPELAARDFSSFPRLLFGAMFVIAGLTEQPDRPKARRLFLIDEARVLGGMDILTNVRDAGRSIGMHLMLIYQNYGQLVEAWGGDAGASAWFDSCEARVVSAVGSSRTASDIVTMLGKHTIRTRTQGSSSSAAPLAPMTGTLGTSEQEQLREVPLMSAATLGQLPVHGALIFTRKSKPILATKAIWFTRPDMKDRVKSPEDVAEHLAATKRHAQVMQRIAEAQEPPNAKKEPQEEAAKSVSPEDGFPEVEPDIDYDIGPRPGDRNAGDAQAEGDSDTQHAPASLHTGVEAQEAGEDPDVGENVTLSATEAQLIARLRAGGPWLAEAALGSLDAVQENPVPPQPDDAEHDGETPSSMTPTPDPSRVEPDISGCPGAAADPGPKEPSEAVGTDGASGAPGDAETPGTGSAEPETNPQGSAGKTGASPGRDGPDAASGPDTGKKEKTARHGSRWLQEDDARMFAMLKEGQSHAEVGKEIGRSAHAVRKRLEKLEEIRNAETPDVPASPDAP